MVLKEIIRHQDRPGIFEDCLDIEYIRITISNIDFNFWGQSVSQASFQIPITCDNELSHILEMASRVFNLKKDVQISIGEKILNKWNCKYGIISKINRADDFEIWDRFVYNEQSIFYGDYRFMWQ